MTPPHALRHALCVMLTDPVYPVALKSAPWVEKHLAPHAAAWDTERTEQLTRLALRWADSQKNDVEIALRKALGEEESYTLWPSQRNAPANRVDGRRGMAATSLQQDAAMDSIATDPAEVTHGVESHADVTWSRILDQLNKPPYNTPATKWTRAVDWAQTGRVTRTGTQPDTFTVRSNTDKDKTYVVSWEGCACHRSQHGPTKWCYHLVAALLFDRYEKTMQPELFSTPHTIDERLAKEPPMPEPTEAEYIPEPVSPVLTPQITLAFPDTQHLTHAGAVMHEAPFSATISVENPAGYHTLLTVRGTKGEEFFEAFTKMVGWCERHGWKPQQRASAAPRSHAEAQTTQEPAPAVSAPTGHPGAPPKCNLHNRAMKPSQYGGWHCTSKLGDGSYCTEKHAA